MGSTRPWEGGSYKGSSGYQPRSSCIPRSIAPSIPGAAPANMAASLRLRTSCADFGTVCHPCRKDVYFATAA